MLLLIYYHIKIITFYQGDNIQYGETNNWNPLNGSQYSDQQNTRRSSTRVNSTGGRATYGTLSSSLSQKSTNRTRSARRKANRDITSLLQESPRNTGPSRRDSTAPEIIDITNSDSDNDDDKVVEDSQIIEVGSCFPFLVASIRFSSFFINNLMLPCLPLFTPEFVVHLKAPCYQLSST